MPVSTFSFYRVDGLSLDALVVVEVLHRPELEPDRIVAAITRATTSWVNNTEAGQNAWEGSHRDLNMGDLVDHVCDPYLRAALATEGILQLHHLHTLSVTNGVCLDTILVDQDNLTESRKS